jgi:hypothetical protein
MKSNNKVEASKGLDLKGFNMYTINSYGITFSHTDLTHQVTVIHQYHTKIFKYCYFQCS